MNLLAKEPTSVWWKLKVAITSLFWVTRPIDKRKPWKEFYYGMINHECEFDYDNLKFDKYGKFYECKHFGCNVVTIMDKNKKWLNC